MAAERSMSARRELLWLSGALLLVALFVLPAVHTPFRFDDTFYFEIRTGALHVEGIDFRQHVEESAEHLTSNGRFQPVGLVFTVVPWVFSDAPVLYKLYLIATALLALALLYRLLRRLGVGAGPVLLAVVLFGAVVQFRWFHDSMLGYSGLAQWSLVLLAGALLCWLRWDERGGRGRLAAAVVLWTACISLYDANFALLGVAAGVVLVRRPALPAFARGMLPFALPALLLALITLVVRLQLDRTYSGYSPSYGLGEIARTWLVTVVGALPGSHALLDPKQLMGDFARAELFAGAWRGLVAGALVAAIGRRWAPTRREIVAAVAVGLPLWLLPSALLALSARYQEELQFGDAYLPGLLQSAGVAILLATGGVAAVSALRRHASRAAAVAGTVAVAAVVGLGAAADGTSNMRVVAHERPVAESRALLYDGLRNGVLERLPDGATTVIFSRDLNWYPSNYTFATTTLAAVTLDRTGRRFDMRSDRQLDEPRCRPAPGEWPVPACAAPSDRGGWLAVRPVRDGGATVLAEAPAGRVLDRDAPATGLTVYAEGTLADGDPPVIVGLTADGRPWSSAGKVTWQTLPSSGGRLLTATLEETALLRPTVGTIDVDGAVTDFVNPAPAPQRSRALGLAGLLP